MLTGRSTASDPVPRPAETAEQEKHGFSPPRASVLHWEPEESVPVTSVQDAGRGLASSRGLKPLPAIPKCSLRTYLTHVLVPIPEAQQQMGQHMNHVRLEELSQHGAEHLEGKEGSWGRRQDGWEQDVLSGQLQDKLPTTSSASGKHSGQLWD